MGEDLPPFSTLGTDDIERRSTEEGVCYVKAEENLQEKKFHWHQRKRNKNFHFAESIIHETVDITHVNTYFIFSPSFLSHLRLHGGQAGFCREGEGLKRGERETGLGFSAWSGREQLQRGEAFSVL